VTRGHRGSFAAELCSSIELEKGRERDRAVDEHCRQRPARSAGPAWFFAKLILNDRNVGCQALGGSSAAARAGGLGYGELRVRQNRNSRPGAGKGVWAGNFSRSTSVELQRLDDGMAMWSKCAGTAKQPAGRHQVGSCLPKRR